MSRQECLCVYKIDNDVTIINRHVVMGIPYAHIADLFGKALMNGRIVAEDNGLAVGALRETLNAINNYIKNYRGKDASVERGCNIFSKKMRAIEIDTGKKLHVFMHVDFIMESNNVFAMIFSVGHNKEFQADLVCFTYRNIWKSCGSSDNEDFQICRKQTQGLIQILNVIQKEPLDQFEASKIWSEEKTVFKCIEKNVYNISGDHNMVIEAFNEILEKGKSVLLKIDGPAGLVPVSPVSEQK
jgi:hypothetical protein